jgi:hypothetical protein
VLLAIQPLTFPTTEDGFTAEDAEVAEIAKRSGSLNEMLFSTTHILFSFSLSILRLCDLRVLCG